MITIWENSCLVWQIGSARVNEVDAWKSFNSQLGLSTKNETWEGFVRFSCAIVWALRCFFTVIG